VGWQKACVALANKNARILWAVMKREQGFDPRHVTVKPRAKVSLKERAAVSAQAAVTCPTWRPEQDRSDRNPTTEIVHDGRALENALTGQTGSQ
jgi:hypothetical protein